MVITIKIPEYVVCLIKKGQIADFNTPYLEKQTISPISITVANQLGIKPNSIFKYLKKFVGDSIQQGELLAEKKGLFGNQKIISEVSGIIKEINHYDGEVKILAYSGEKEQFMAPFKGEVIEVTKDNIRFKVDHGKEFELKHASASFGGKVCYMEKSQTIFKADEIANKIIVIESISPYIYTKIEALGAKGIVVLKNYIETPSQLSAQIKNIPDFERIKSFANLHCFVNKEFSRIYFYR